MSNTNRWLAFLQREQDDRDSKAAARLARSLYRSRPPVSMDEPAQEPAQEPAPLPF